MKNQDSDALLAKRIKKGDQGAASLLYKKYAPRIYSIIFTLLKSKMDAEDFTQDVFLKAITGLQNNTYKEDGQLFPWLVRIARNLCLDNFRTSRHKTSKVTTSVYRSTGEDREWVPIDTICPYGTPESIYIENELIFLTRAEIEKLPWRLREVMEKRLDGFSFREIAQEKGLNLQTTVSRAHQAKLLLLQSKTLRKVA